MQYYRIFSKLVKKNRLEKVGNEVFKGVFQKYPDMMEFFETDENRRLKKKRRTSGEIKCCDIHALFKGTFLNNNKSRFLNKNLNILKMI